MITQSWPALAAWGAGLIQLALGAGFITGTGAAPLRGFGAVLVAAAVAALVWGALWLAQRFHPRWGVGIAVSGVVLTGAALFSDPAHVPVLAVAVAIALWAAAGLSITATRRRSATPRRRSPRAGVVGIVLGSIVVAATVTPALASTEAGRLAPDHSTHTFVTEHSH